MLVNLEPLIAASETPRSAYFENVLDAMTVDGGLYAMPTSVNCDVVVFNEAVLRENDSNILEKESLTYLEVIDELLRCAEQNDKLFLGLDTGY